MSINEAADKAAAHSALYGAQQQAQCGGYPPPPMGVKAEQVIDYLLVHYGHAVEQNDHMRVRVWQLESVNDNHLRSRQELCDAVFEMRQRISQLEDELAAAKAATLSAEIVMGIAEKRANDLADRCRKLQEEFGFVEPVVSATYWGRGGRTLERELPITSVQSGQGRVKITVDLRNSSRKRAD